MAGPVEEAGKVAGSTIEAMKSVPLALALLVVNCIFIAFNGYILSAVASNAAERNKTQMDLIGQMVHDIRDCRQGPKLQSARSLLFLPPPPIPWLTEIPVNAGP
jgi:hypothetical protein